MIRQTSIEAYYKIRDEGLLSKRRWEVYDILYHKGPLTSAEVFAIINRERPNGAITSSRARFTELRDMGVAMECGTTKCSITGMTAILWDVTNGLPVEPKKKERTCPQICQYCRELEQRVIKLEEALRSRGQQEFFV